MAQSYVGKQLSGRAIYPTRFMPHLILLGIAKFGRAFGIFLSYDLLKVIHVVQFLFLVMAGTGAILLLLQKPFSSGERLSKRQMFRIIRHAFIGCIIKLLWLLGITLCGPLRSILLYDHSDMVVIAGASALFTSGGSPAKFRGAVFWVLGVLGILLFDHDDLNEHIQEAPGLHGHSGVLTHLFDHMTDLTGLSDHKGGVVLMVIALCMTVGFNNAAKKLSLNVGGAKRLNALSTIVSSLLLAPWAFFVFATRESQVVSWLWMIPPMVLIIGLVFIVDYYVESVCIGKLDTSRTYHLGAVAVFISGLLLSCVWSYPFSNLVASNQQIRQITAEEHVLSGGVIFSLILFIFATSLLTNQSRSASRGSFIGYSSSGLPLYSFTENTLHKTSQSVLSFMRKGLRQVLDESDSRRIFYFLCINLMFTFIELIYGVWTNSLGLISDGFHMLFDCSALVMGLYAALMSRWKATRIYSYGYDRVEVLSGFINALFLMVIAFFVFCAACGRLMDPPEIKTERLLAVSVLGLLVNLVGIFAFHHGHSHGGGGSHGHSHGGSSHGHSHGSSPHGHSHSHGHSHGGGHGHSHGGGGGTGGDLNTNMHGVFLHVLADTMGSVGVIISTLLIENFGWKVADPICSIFIAVLIFASVVPLVKDTCSILLLRTPEELEPQISLALQNICDLEGVVSYRDVHVWRHSSKAVCATISLQVKSEVSEQKITSQVNLLLREIGVQHVAIQVEKHSFFQHMSGLGSVQPFPEASKNNIPPYNALGSQYIKAV